MSIFKDILSIFKEPCTLWFNRLLGRDWSHCCINHDDEYGSAELSYDKEFFRLMYDEELKDCVNKEFKGMGNVMFIGVRMFGRFFIAGLLLFLAGCSIKPPTPRAAYSQGELDMISECREWVASQETNKDKQASRVPADQIAFVVMHQETMEMIKQTFGKAKDICQPGGDDGYFKAYAAYAENQKEIAVKGMETGGSVLKTGLMVYGAVETVKNVGSRDTTTTNTTETTTTNTETNTEIP